MLAFVPGGQTHANRFHHDVRTFDVGLSDTWVERLRPLGFADRPVEHDGGPSSWVAMRLYREFLYQDDVTPWMLEGLTLELLAQMSRGELGRVERSTPRWLSRTVEFLHAHFTESLSLARIAAVGGVHADHLTRAFRRHHRVSIGDYVRRLRIDYACRLLTFSDASLSEVALQVGFADQSHFQKNFKALTGLTPAQFRRSSDAGLRQSKLP
jgi:AraC family transcriptional regulator